MSNDGSFDLLQERWFSLYKWACEVKLVLESKGVAVPEIPWVNSCKAGLCLYPTENGATYCKRHSSME